MNQQVAHCSSYLLSSVSNAACTAESDGLYWRLLPLFQGPSPFLVDIYMVDLVTDSPVRQCPGQLVYSLMLEDGAANHVHSLDTGPQIVVH